MHVIQCPELQNERDAFKVKLRTEVITLSKNTRNLEGEAYQFVENIIKFLNRQEEVGGFQCVLGYKNLFRGYIVRCWMHANNTEEKYAHYNVMFVRECVRFYNRCWKHRCQLVTDDINRKETLLQEIGKIKMEHQNTNKVGVRSYLRKCPSNLTVQTNEYLAQWIRGFNYIRKNSPTISSGDIRSYFATNS